MSNDLLDVGYHLVQGDCLDWMREQPNDCVDLTIGSPPYESQRTYGIDFNLQGQAWVDWMVERIREMVRITRGLVAMVVDGPTRNYRWSATPVLLQADLHRAGIHMRRPVIYKRDGIPGSGGPDWWKNLYELVVCCTKGGRLPWSDNTANGHPPKYPPGGAPSHRKADGERVRGNYKPPALANAGNIIDCGPAGGGRIGSELAHETEAPFPEQLVEPFIKCFCPPGGRVFDPFCGSATTGAVALRLGRRFIGTDIRQSQVDLSERRIREALQPIVAPESAALESLDGQQLLF